MKRRKHKLFFLQNIKFSPLQTIVKHKLSDDNIIDIETFRRRIGLFQQRSTNYKRINEVFTNEPITDRKDYLPDNTIVLKNTINRKVLLVSSIMTTTILWTPVLLKNASKVFVYRNNEEKILFNQAQNSESNLVHARNHPNFFIKCLEKNVYPKNLDVKSEHFNIGFATNNIKESLNQLDQKSITEKISIYITHFKLKVIRKGDCNK